MPDLCPPPHPARGILAGAGGVGLLAAAGVWSLLILLNPGVAADPRDAGALIAITGAFYLAVSLVLATPLALVSHLRRRSFTGRVYPGGGSVIAAGVAFGLGYLFRSNAAAYEVCVPCWTARALPVYGYIFLLLGGAFLTAAALGPSGKLMKRVALVAALAAAAGAFIVARRVPPSPPSPSPPALARVETGLKVCVVGVDALDPDVVRPLAARGVMPCTARLINDGASGELSTIPPGLSPAIWTTIATGVYPRNHGILDYEYLRLSGLKTPLYVFPSRTFLSLLTRVGIAELKPFNATCRRAPTFWNIAGAAGLPVRVVAWHTTTPPDVVNGVMVSDGYHYGEAIPRYPAETDVTPYIYYAADASLRTEAERRLLPRGVPPRDNELFYRIYAQGKTYHEIAKALSTSSPASLSASYFDAGDAYSHLYWRFREDVGPASEKEKRAWGGVVDRAYAWADAYIADVAHPGPDTVVIVVSDHGCETASWARRAYYRYWQGRDVSGVHDVIPPPAGFVAAAGGPVRKGVLLKNASVLDVAPNVLYLLGLPVAADMPGRLWLEAYDEDFVEAFPPRPVPTYAGLKVTQAPMTTGADDARARRRATLKALGYLQ